MQEKVTNYDESLAYLINLGYPVQVANNALKISKGNCQQAIDYLLAKSTGSSINLESRAVGGGGSVVDVAGRKSKVGRVGSGFDSKDRIKGVERYAYDTDLVRLLS